MPPVGFEPKISAGERPQFYSLKRAATEMGLIVSIAIKNIKEVSFLELNLN